MSLLRVHFRSGAMHEVEGVDLCIVDEGRQLLFLDARGDPISRELLKTIDHIEVLGAATEVR